MKPVTDMLPYHKIEELLAVLEIDIQQIQESIQYLDQLRVLIVKRDDQRLQALLEQIRQEADQHTVHEARRIRIRTALAQDLHMDVKQMTLSMLQMALAEPLKSRVADKKRELRAGVARLRAQYQSTRILLHDCARFNRSLFNALFQQNKTQPLVYGPQGIIKRQTGNNLMNMQF